MQHRLNKLLLAVTASVAMPLFADTLSLQPATSDIHVGQSFFLDVWITGATDLYGYQFDVGYNPSIVAATAVTEGAFLSGAGSTTFIPGAIDNGGGTISFIADILNGAPSGRTGDGTLVTLGFTAVGVGSSPVTLFNLIALNSFGEGLTVDLTGATIAVSPSPAVPEASPVFALLLATGLLGLRLYWIRHPAGAL